MIPKNKSQKRYRYGPYEGLEPRTQRRIQNDLGFDKAAAEAILHLRSQVIELKTQIHQLEVELNAQNTSQQIRLAQYQEIYSEAVWIELKF
jgi:hypothetical protein